MVQKILRRREMPAVTGLGITRIYEMIGEGKFPRPIQLSERAVGWLESEVADWQRERTKARDGVAA